MFRLPRDRKSRIQLALVVLFIGAFAFAVKTVADYLDWTARAVDLRDAISRGDLDAVKQFEADGVDWRDLDDTPNDYSALLQAIAGNHLQLVRYFVEKGDDITAKSREGFAPVSLADEYGHLDILKYLLMETPEGEAIAQTQEFAHGFGIYADLELVGWLSSRRDLKDTISPDDAHRLLWLAVNEEDVEMVEYLLEIGAPAGMDNESWDEGFHRAPQSNGADAVPWLALYSGPNHFPLLHHAVKLGNESIATLLLDHGANPKTEDPHGKTPTDYARENGHDGVVRELEAALAKD